jgi:hypothetical protein
MNGSDVFNFIYSSVTVHIPWPRERSENSPANYKKKSDKLLEAWKQHLRVGVEEGFILDILNIYNKEVTLLCERFLKE